MQKNILVIGPSVTAEKEGYVEIANASSRKNPSINFEKVGLGGMFPQQIKHLFSAIVAEKTPDIVVLEFATAPARQADNINVRREGIESMLDICRSMNLPAGILDLPRADMDPQSDWVTELHAEIAHATSCHYREVPLQIELLVDAVHPSREGRKVYAEALLDLADMLLSARPPVETRTPMASFGCIRAKDHLEGEVNCVEYNFERS